MALPEIVTDGEDTSDSLLRRLAGRLQKSVGDTSAQFTAEARAAVKRSQQEAVNLGAPAIGPEHLLLALLAPEAGGSAGALASAGVQRDTLRNAIQDMSARVAPNDRHRAPARLAPSTKKALELSLREALRRGDDCIGSEHVLLGLLRASDNRLRLMLDSVGVTPEAIRDAVGVLPRAQ
jgi:ATP-dependent Clp protease ATP-binding subunit ClpC